MKQDKLYKIKCLGAIHNPKHEFLGRDEKNGNVILVSKDDTNSNWKCELNNDEVIVKWEGAQIIKDVFLDGRTQDGSVGLAPKTTPPFTGTHWKMEGEGAGKKGVAFKCLGAIHIPEHQFLNGHTVTGKVDLVPNTQDPYTGAHWELIEVSPD